MVPLLIDAARVDELIEPIIKGAVRPLTMPVSTPRKSRARLGLARFQTLNKKASINFPHHGKAKRQASSLPKQKI
jgi:hypothetical protein